MLLGTRAERDAARPLSRRRLLLDAAGGLGSLVLATLLRRDGFAAAPPDDPVRPWRSIAPRAKNVIYLFMSGGTSQVDLFDPKPVLNARDGEPCPDAFFEREKLAFIKERPQLLGSPYAFARSGKCGREISELMPELRTVVDDITMIKSMQTGHFNHTQAQLLALTGSTRYGRPSAGAWISYGLGNESDNLPTFVVMNSGGLPALGGGGWGPGFLPSVHQGVVFRSSGDPVLFLTDPQGTPRELRAKTIDCINELNRFQLDETDDPEVETRMKQYEMAFRMQAAVPEAVDISSEPESIHRLYGTSFRQESFANNCLLARRLVERGVRFVQLFDSDWDHHLAIFDLMPFKCRQVDRAAAALVTDLKQRGLLDETLVVFGTEFGRTPMAQVTEGTRPGRDHDLSTFTIWLAGGGVKAGFEYGKSDEIGYAAIENPVHVHDLNATMLHLLGVDHKRLTVRFQGRDFRLTDVHGEIVHDIIA